MNIKVVVGVVAAFAAGAAVGFLCPRSAETGAEETAPAVSKAKGDGGELAAARKRIGELEQRVASLTAAKPKKEQKKVKEDKGEEGVVTIDGSSTNLFAELEKKLPAEEFSQVTNAFERMKQARQKRVKGKLEFLASVDTSRMHAGELATHEEYMKLVAKQEELMGKSKGLIPDQKSLEKLVMLQMKMKPLADAERKTLLRQMSGNLGYSGDDANVVVDTVGDIVGATTPGGIGDVLGSMTDMMGGGESGDGGPAVEVQTQVLTL